MNLGRQVTELLRESEEQKEHQEALHHIKLLIIETLKTRDEPEALVALARGCFLKDEVVAQRCKGVIKVLPPNKVEPIWTFIFETEFYRDVKKFLELMGELCGTGMMHYVLRNLRSDPAKAEQYKQFAPWLRDSGTINKFLHTILTSHPKTAQKAITLLTHLDKNVPRYLANMLESLAPEMTIKALRLLAGFNLESIMTAVPIRKLIKHPNSEVRAHTAYLLGCTLHNTMFIEYVLRDPVPNVRLSVLKSIEKSLPESSPKLIDILHTALEDLDEGVRAKAVQILHIFQDVKGLHTLISMLESSLPSERAYAAGFLGELKELSARDKLQQLAQDDLNQRVRGEAQKALKTLEEEVEVLHEEFEALIGLLTQHQLSGAKKDDLRLWDYLEGLDENALEGMIQATGLSHDVVQQFMGIVHELGMQGIAVPFLLATIIDEDGEVNQEKIADFNQMKAEVSKIVTQLQSSDPEAVTSIFEDLTTIRQNAINALLIPALEGKNPEVMATSAKTLHELEYKIGTDTLSEMVADADSTKRREAVKALATVFDQFAADGLKQLEDDPDPEIQELAQRGLTHVNAKLERNNLREIQVEIKDVDLTEFPTVRLYVSVSDPYSQPLIDLEVNDFTILEGKERPLKVELTSRYSRRAIAVVMVMDYSSSMTHAAIRDVEKAARRFTDKLMPKDQAVIIKCADEVQVIQPLTGDKERIVRAIEAPYTLSTQGTALYDAIYQAIGELDGILGSTKIVIINTDGEDTSSQKKRYDITNLAAIHKDTAVYTIGLGDQADAGMLKQISNLTDGCYYAAREPSELEHIYEAIFKGIRFEYVLTYQSKSKASQIDASSRNVEVYVDYGRCQERNIVMLSPQES